MQDTSCLVLPIPAHAFFKQAVLQGEIGHDLLQGGCLTTKVLHLNTGGGSGAGCSSTLVPPALYPARISVSSSLLAATMNQKSSLREDPQFVSWVLTGNSCNTKITRSLAFRRFCVRVRQADKPIRLLDDPFHEQDA
jgi:hypothetical protein